MIQLRPAGEKDDAFIETVYGSTREEELNFTNWEEYRKQAFIKMQFELKISNPFFQRRLLDTASFFWLLPAGYFQLDFLGCISVLNFAGRFKKNQQPGMLIIC